MNDISTSIETQSYAANTTENGSRETGDTGKSVFGEKTQKKDGLGVFAKILDGLVSKPKNGAGLGTFGKALGKNESLSDAAEEKQGEKTTKGSSRGKKSALSGIEGLESALSGGEAGVIQQNQALLNKEGLDGALAKGSDRENRGDVSEITTESRSLWDFGSVDELPAGGSLINAAGKKTTEEGLSDLSIKEVAEFLDMLKDADLDSAENGGKRGRRGVVDFLQASARDVEANLYQFPGTPRPGLVDTLADVRAESKEASEGRGKRGKDRLSVDVRDFRTGVVRGGEAGTGDKTKISALTGLQPERIDADITVELGSGDSRENSVTEAAGRQDFGDSLARELRNHLNTDIVKQAQFILRDGGEGIIRLSLKPESLGNVKVRLEMTENKITGHIVVESTEAFKAFERELPVLEKAFQDSGFGETSLDMSFAQDSSSFGGNFGSGQDGDFPRFSPVFAASRYDAEETVSAVSSLSMANPSGKAAVNLLV